MPRSRFPGCLAGEPGADEPPIAAGPWAMLRLLRPPTAVIGPTLRRPAQQGRSFGSRRPGTAYPDGYAQSRSGDEALTWSDAYGRDAKSVKFTRQETWLPEEPPGRKRGITSVGVSARGTRPHPDQPAHVPVDHSPDSPLPMCSDEVSP